MPKLKEELRSHLLQELLLQMKSIELVGREQPVEPQQFEGQLGQVD